MCFPRNSGYIQTLEKKKKILGGGGWRRPGGGRMGVYVGGMMEKDVVAGGRPSWVGGRGGGAGFRQQEDG